MRGGPLRRFSRALGAFSLLSACAASLPAAPSPDSAPRARGSAEREVGRYGLEPAVTLSDEEARAIQLARTRLSRAGHPPRTSGALVVAARELARLAAGGAADALARGRVRAALARAHAYDPGAAAVLARAPGGAAADAVARSLPRSEATHVGAGAFVRGDEVFLVLLVSERKASLSPFPRDVAPGTRATLRGELSAGLARPRVFTTLPSGEVLEAQTSGDRRFRASLSFPKAGRYAVEVLGEGPSGPEVAALLTVSAGGAPLDPAAPAGREVEPPDDDGAEAAVVRAVNATRRRHGLPPLTSAPELAAVARRHSRAMAAAGRVAHVLPGSGDLASRLRRAGIPFRRVYENVARAGTALDAHEAAEESPAHLGNVLEEGPTRIGVGIARSRLPSGDPTVYLTEIFVEPPDDGASSRLTPEGRVREALWAERARADLPPLTADAALDALARDAAAVMLARDATEAPDLASRALALRRELAGVDVFVASAPREAARSSNLRDRRFRRVGVGVATGDSRRFGAGRIWIAVVYTD